MQKWYKLSLRGAERRSNPNYSRIGDCHALTLFGLAMTFTFYFSLIALYFCKAFGDEDFVF